MCGIIGFIMIIIKQGDPDAIKEYKRFECKKCGCIWEAERGEYKSGNQYNETYYYSTCPTCSVVAYTRW